MNDEEEKMVNYITVHQLIDALDQISDEDLYELGYERVRSQCKKCGSASWATCWPGDDGEIAKCSDCPGYYEHH